VAAITLENKIKLASAILIPLVLVWLGFIAENAIGAKENIVDKRIEIYEQVGPLLNDIFVHVQHVGHWKQIDQAAAIRAKRDADRLMYSNQAFWSPQLFEAYLQYMNSAFDTYVAEGEDAVPKKFSSKHKNNYNLLMQKFNADFH
jgi:hypothetical protein